MFSNVAVDSLSELYFWIKNSSVTSAKLLIKWQNHGFANNE